MPYNNTFIFFIYYSKFIPHKISKRISQSARHFTEKGYPLDVRTWGATSGVLLIKADQDSIC